MTAEKTKNQKIKPDRLAGKHREFFIENFQMMMATDITIDDALSSIKAVSTSPQLKKALEKAQGYIDEGMPLWKALSLTGLISEQAASFVFIGEETGQLSEKMKMAASMERKQRQQKAEVKAALTYPVFVITLTLIVGLGIAMLILPRLAVTFEQLRVELPLLTKLMLGFGKLLQAHGKVIIPASIGLLLLVNYLLFVAPYTRRAGYALLMRTPGVRTLLNEVEIAKLGQMLSALLSAGVPITKSFDLLQKTTEHPKYKAFYQRLREALAEGFSLNHELSKPAKQGNMLPPTISQLIIVGEKSGKLQETFDEIGRIYDKKTSATIKSLEVMLEPILLVVVWGGVMVLATGVFMPIYKLIGGLQQ